MHKKSVMAKVIGKRAMCMSRGKREWKVTGRRKGVYVEGADRCAIRSRRDKVKKPRSNA